MMFAPRLAAVLGALMLTGISLAAQQQVPELIRQAVTLIRANQADSADVLLRFALDSGVYATRAQVQSAWVWRAVIAHYRSNDTLTRRFFRKALALDTTMTVAGLGEISPALDSVFLEEKREAFSRALIHDFAAVEEPPRRISGPSLAYPPALYGRPVAGPARMMLVVDGSGRPEGGSVEVLETPDSALVQPLTAMILASQFAPGRHRGRPVRVWMALRLEVRPPRFNATELVRQARALTPRRRDSALTLLDLALGPLAGPSDGERAFALLARGAARASAGRDTLARRDYVAGLALIDTVRARGVDLAPFVVRLADSVRRAAVPRASLSQPRVVGTASQPPVLVTHPPLRYPPEARQLGVGGTVVIEVVVDSAGRVNPQSARVIESTNPIFNAEALRVVRAAQYRPGRTDGRAVGVVIQQPVSFVEY